MRGNTTLMIWCRSEPFNVDKKIFSLRVYGHKYVNIDRIILLDCGLSKGAKEIIKSNIGEKVFLAEKKGCESDKHLLVETLKTITSDNIIFFDLNLNLKFHQIQRQIKKLHRAKIVLPNRFDKESRTTFCSKNNETFIRFKNIIGIFLSGLPYPDLSNNNRCFKNKILLPLLLNSKTNLFFWLEVLREARRKGIKISICRTHYIEEKVYVKKQSFFKEIVGLYKKK